MGGVERHSGTARRGREGLPEVWEGLGCPSGGLRGVRSPPRRARRNGKPCRSARRA